MPPVQNEANKRNLGLTLAQESHFLSLECRKWNEKFLPDTFYFNYSFNYPESWAVLYSQHDFISFNFSGTLEGNETSAWRIEDSLYLSNQGSLEHEGTASGDLLLCKASWSYQEVEVPNHPKGTHNLKGEDSMCLKHKSHTVTAKREGPIEELSSAGRVT